jgi:undecaprenyl pyrophosphate phosphatase UppP
LFQAVSILPGISRSGASISSGLFRGLNKEEAMKQARETVMQAITGQKTPSAADPAVVNKIQDLFNLTKEDAERVIAIRNELQIMD